MVQESSDRSVGCSLECGGVRHRQVHRREGRGFRGLAHFVEELHEASREDEGQEPCLFGFDDERVSSLRRHQDECARGCPDLLFAEKVGEFPLENVEALDLASVSMDGGPDPDTAPDFEYLRRVLSLVALGLPRKEPPKGPRAATLVLGKRIGFRDRVEPRHRPRGAPRGTGFLNLPNPPILRRHSLEALRSGPACTGRC